MIPKPESQTSAREKVVSLEELAARVKQAKAAGKKVVYAHGVFDLLHIGHVRHLETARQHGSFLVVTITADAFVNKGPGRPAFPDYLRAEMLAALVHIDAVAINHEFTAENAIRLLKPDVYVKGTEYSDAQADVTGKITAEREAVESGGGEILFTDEMTFSSSNLINRHFTTHDPSAHAFLDAMRNEDKLTTLLKNVEQLSDLKVLLIGDTIIDEYQYVEALGRPSKESIVATQFIDREIFAGGAVAAANHLAAFCKHVELITALGVQESHEDLVRNSLKSNVTLTPLMREDSRTTRKCRFVDMSYSLRKLFEVYFMNDQPLGRSDQMKLDDVISERLKQYDLVVVTDFGHGFLHGSTVDLLTKKAPFLAVNTQTNSGNHGYNLISKYPRADYICLDGPEARLAVRDKYLDSENVILRLPEVIDCDRMIVTAGRDGCIAYDRNADTSRSARVQHVPALTSMIVDTVGAGDAFFAVTAPMVFRGVPMTDVGFLGNAAGAMKVGIVGHRSSVEKAPYIKFLTALLK